MQEKYTESEAKSLLEDLLTRAYRTLGEAGVSLNKETVAKAVADRDWQYVRICGLSLSLSTKASLLLEYESRQGQTVERAVRIANYINALKRGGLL